MTMTRPQKVNAGKWCQRCHHMIRFVPREGWLHVSDDDWAVPSFPGKEHMTGECPCANGLIACAPEGRHRTGWPLGWTYVGTTTTDSTVTLASGRTLTLGPGFLYVTKELP